MAEWHTLVSARDQWVDAPLNDEELQELLDVAQNAVLAYAPTLVEGALIIEDGIVVVAGPNEIPVSYRYAQLMQARNVWNSSQASPSSSDFDGAGYGLTTFPLDWQVKQLLRPRTVFGGVVG
jgi:hypothetical protein